MNGDLPPIKKAAPASKLEQQQQHGSVCDNESQTVNGTPGLLERREIRNERIAKLERFVKQHPEIFEEFLSRRNGSESRASKLPPIENCAEMARERLVMRSEVIKGLLRKGSKMLIGGSSKSRKTWTLLDLACCVSLGVSWLDRFETNQGKVLYINFELHRDTFRHRLEKKICPSFAMSEEEILKNLDSWCLRGFAADYKEIVPKIIEATKERGYDLIIVDPTYKILGDADENSATAVTDLMNHLEQIAHQTQAAILITNHYSKGNKAEAQDGDRSSGSGVFFRDPDAVVEFVEQEESKDKDIFSVRVQQREFAPVEPFCVQWDGEACFRKSDHDPKKLKGGAGAPKRHTETDVIEVLQSAGESGYSSTEWFEACSDERGTARKTFYDLKKDILDKKLVRQEGTGKGARYFAIKESLN